MPNDSADARRFRLQQAEDLLRELGYIEQPDGSWMPPPELSPLDLGDGKLTVDPRHSGVGKVLTVDPRIPGRVRLTSAGDDAAPPAGRH